VISSNTRSKIPAADTFIVQRKANLVFRLTRLALLPLFAAIFHFVIKGRENLPRKGGFVVVGNHLNWLDSMTILYAFPPQPRVHFLGDPELLQTRRFQWALTRRAGGYIPVDRKQRNQRPMFRQVERCLRDGGVVVIYPEANYGANEGELMPFTRGFAYFAKRSGVPIVPVAMSGCKDLWLRKTIRVMIGKPIEPHGDLDEMTDATRAAMLDLLPSYCEPGGPKLLRRWLTNLL
jgi:1-acyl-sn-glycerol-3-phosphate acyltransferase